MFSSLYSYRSVAGLSHVPTTVHMAVLNFPLLLLIPWFGFGSLHLSENQLEENLKRKCIMPPALKE